ncbi:unnamed protein product [Halorubrum sp. DM2]|uniref:hypothetical protein n=1 Tax=Halorubrum sp. DM2 TaxID=2527867 RepID=UPI0024B81F62|nr:hypothetical protein [Halorubrum sp. DM2]VTT87317.1 unnamed protein product [Halorubrum sp. DM2]
MPNRRNVLIGLGGLVAGGGALIGTGAFTTVEAERTVTVNTAGDSSALLAFAEAGDGTGSDVVNIVDGLLTINFDNASGENGSGDDLAGGVNLNARTTIGAVSGGDPPDTVDTAAFTITNNGSQTVDISFDIGFNGNQNSLPSGTNPEDILKLWTDASGTEDIGGDIGNLVATDLTGLESGNSVDVALQIDTVGFDSTDLNTDAPLFETEATITATNPP